jgi:acetyl-CoA acetyltransferase
MSTDVFIVSAARTPIATAYKGSLIGVDAFALAEVAIGEAVKRSGIPVDQIEDMGIGESMQGGGNVGRNVAVRLGMTNVPGVAMQR